MADATFNVSHAEPLGALPHCWTDYWKLVLSREAGLVYEALSDERLAGTEVSIGRLINYLGLSKNRFGVAVQELEARGFLWLDAEERPPAITVQSVPEVDPDAPLPAPKNLPKTSWRKVWEFINHWCALHERYVEEPYPRPQRGRGRDTVDIDEMLRTYSLETLKAVATWFFDHRQKGEEPSTLAYFKFHLPRLVSEWKDAGGVVLAKMRESTEA